MDDGDAFAYRSPEGLEPEVRDSIAVPTRLRSAWMPHMSSGSTFKN